MYDGTGVVRVQCLVLYILLYWYPRTYDVIVIT